jgi:hypothetical protein
MSENRAVALIKLHAKCVKKSLTLGKGGGLETAAPW